MKFNLNQEDRADVSITPLIDVVFLLLIFFMVTTTFDVNTSLRIDLPEADTAVKMQERKHLEVVIDRHGQYYMDGKSLLDKNSRTLRIALDKVIEKYKAEKIIIRADAQAPHQSVVSVMDTAGKLGVSQISIATTGGQDSE